MTLPVVSILVYFGAEFSNGQFFTLDDPVKGEIDNGTYLIAGDDGDGVEIATDGFQVSITRGRSRELDEFSVGTASVSLYNFTRAYDALNTAGIYYGDLVPGKRVVIKVWNQVVFTGTIEDWNLNWDVGGGDTATFQAEDCLGALGRAEFDAWTTVAGEDAGARITAILDRPEIGFGANRDIGVGTSTLQADSVTWGSNALNYGQLVTKSESGRLYASLDNLLTFRGRHSLLYATVPLEFRDDIHTIADPDGTDLVTDVGDLIGATAVPFHGITTQVGSELLFNRVGIDREGGTLQTTEDDDSIDAYGVRALSVTGLLMDSDIQSQSMSEYICSIYAQPTPRVDSVLVRVAALASDDRSAVAQMEIGQLVRVVWSPRNLSPTLDQTAVIEGLEHNLTPDGHDVTFRLAPSTQSGVFILDDPVLGVLDTGPGVLSY